MNKRLGLIVSAVFIVMIVLYASGLHFPVEPSSTHSKPSPLVGDTLFTSWDDDKKGQQIALLDHNKSQITTIIKSGGEVSYDPAWSPDRQAIAYAALENYKEAKTDIFVYDFRSSTKRRITKHEVDTLCGSPTWSPDGKRLAYFTSRRKRRPGGLFETNLFIIDKDGRNVRSLGPGAGPQWSTNESKLLFVGANSAMSVIDIDSRRRTELLDKNDYYSLSGPGAWSPDSKRIAYAKVEEGQKGVLGIYILRLGEGGNRQSVKVGEIDDLISGMQWSPDGKSVVFTRIKDMPLAIPNAPQIYKMSVDSGSLKLLSPRSSYGITGGGVFGAFVLQTYIALLSNANP